MKSKFKILKNPQVLSIGAFAVMTLLSTNGFCADQVVDAGVDGVNEAVKNILFGPTVRKVVLTVGGGAGLFQSFMSGSVRPLLIWGGLGLAVCYLPKFVDLISGISV